MSQCKNMYFLHIFPQATVWSSIFQACLKKQKRMNLKAMVSDCQLFYTQNIITGRTITGLCLNMSRHKIDFVFIGLKGWEKRLIISDRAHIGKSSLDPQGTFEWMHACKNVWDVVRVDAWECMSAAFCERVCPISPSSTVFDFHQAVDGIQEQQRREQAGKK